MKRKKLLSTAVAGALVAAQMVMPVAAAPHNVTVEVSTRSAVIRVEVPTKLTVAVNEFEINDAGTQIATNDFTLTNKSTVPVYVKAETTITPGADVTLVATKAGVVARDDKKGNAWVALAARTSASSYGTIADLTEASANVATVDPSTKKAAQEFYLAAGTGNTVYNLIDATSAVPADLPSYVGEFLPLTEKTKAAPNAEADGTTTTFNGATKDADTTTPPTKTNNVILQELVAAGDVFAHDGSSATLTKVTSTDTYLDSNTYYTTGNGVASITATGKYVYAETAAAASGAATGATAFRLIGTLSSGKNGGWTKDDFSGGSASIALTYDITGVQTSAFTGVADKLTYGLYKEATVPSITSGATAVTAGSADAQAGVTHTATLVNGTDTSIVLSLPTGISVKKVYPGGQLDYFDGSPVENSANAAVAADGKTIVVKGNGPWATGGTATKYVKIIVGAAGNNTSDVSFIVKVAVN